MASVEDADTSRLQADHIVYLAAEYLTEGHEASPYRVCEIDESRTYSERVLIESLFGIRGRTSSIRLMPSPMNVFFWGVRAGVLREPFDWAALERKMRGGSAWPIS